MKYLKPFNERFGTDPDNRSDEQSELVENFKNNIEAIIGPLSDYDYNYTINFYDTKIDIVIYTGVEENDFIKGIEIKEPVLMLMSYLRKKNFKDVDLKIWDDDDYEWKSLFEFDNATIEDLRFECIEITDLKIIVVL
jgi:hypothetical protein